MAAALPFGYKLDRPKTILRAAAIAGGRSKRSGLDNLITELLIKWMFERSAS